MHEFILKLEIDSRVDVPSLSEPFKTMGCRISAEQLRRGFQSSREIIVSMISIGQPCKDLQELCDEILSICEVKGHRTLYDFEALTLNKKRPELQMKAPFVTHSLAFGVPEYRLHVGPDREKHGHELWSIRQFSEFGTPGHLMVATTERSNVDLGTLEGPIIDKILSDSWECHGQKV